MSQTAKFTTASSFSLIAMAGESIHDLLTSDVSQPKQVGSCYSHMICCLCNAKTALIYGVPGASYCGDCGHSECNDCEFE